MRSATLILRDRGPSPAMPMMSYGVRRSYTLSCFPSFQKNQFLIRTSSRSEREWNSIKMKTEDGNLCQIWLWMFSLVSLLLLRRYFNSSATLSLAGLALFLLLIRTSLLPVSWQFIARLLVLFLSIAAGYTFCILYMYRWSPHMKHLLSTCTSILSVTLRGFFPLQLTMHI